jgi:hypothetical protein
MPQVRLIPIIPKRIDYWKYLSQEVNDAADVAAKDMQQGYDDIQKDFNKKSKIHKIRINRPDRIIVQVYYLANDGILSILDLGAKPHPIVAKNAPYLVFRRDYHPATKPKEGLGYPKLATHQRAYSDGHIVKKVAVDHPGVDPRGYTQGLLIYWDKEWYKRMTKAVWRGVRNAR